MQEESKQMDINDNERNLDDDQRIPLSSRKEEEKN